MGGRPGQSIGGALGSIGGALLGTAIEPGVGTVAGAMAGHSAGSSAGAGIAGERQPTLKQHAIGAGTAGVTTGAGSYFGVPGLGTPGPEAAVEPTVEQSTAQAASTAAPPPPLPGPQPQQLNLGADLPPYNFPEYPPIADKYGPSLDPYSFKGPSPPAPFAGGLEERADLYTPSPERGVYPGLSTPSAVLQSLGGNSPQFMANLPSPSPPEPTAIGGFAEQANKYAFPLMAGTSALAVGSQLFQPRRVPPMQSPSPPSRSAYQGPTSNAQMQQLAQLIAQRRQRPLGTFAG